MKIDKKRNLPMFMNTEEVFDLLRIDRLTLYQWKRDNLTFPKAIKISHKKQIWKREEIFAWLKKQPKI